MFFLFEGIYIIIEAFFDLMLCYYYVKHHLFQHLLLIKHQVDIIYL